MADFKVPFASQAGRRPPNADEKINGFPCGPANQQLFNGLFYRLESELGAIIADAGIVPNDADLTQVLQSIKKIVADKLTTTKIPMLNLNSAPWTAVVANIATPPDKPKAGEIYLIADNAIGLWEGKSDSLAEWDGVKWIFSQPTNGHGIGLPDGTQLLRVGDKYWPQTAMDVQSGKWLYAEATTSSSNNYSVSLSPKPLGLWAGAHIYIKMPYANTGPVTLDVNGLNKSSILYPDGGELQGHDFKSNEILSLVFNGSNWQLQPSKSLFDQIYALKRIPTLDFYVIGEKGSDSNTGFSPTTAEGFRTISGAINAISTQYMSNDEVRVHISNGTYNESIVIGRSRIANWKLLGNVASPESVLINATDAPRLTRGLVVGGTSVIVDGISFKAYYECVAATGGGSYLRLDDCCLILTNGTTSTAVGSYSTAVTEIGNNITVRGLGAGCFTSNNSAYIQIGYSDVSINSYSGIRYDNVTVSGSNIVAQSNSSICIKPSMATFTGALTGTRYNANTNGVIETFGSGKNFIPGTADGWVTTGGVYN